MSLRRVLCAGIAGATLLLSSMDAHASAPASDSLERKGDLAAAHFNSESRVNASASSNASDDRGDAPGHTDIVSTALSFDNEKIAVDVTFDQPVPASDSSYWVSDRYGLAALLSFNNSGDIDGTIAFGADGNGNWTTYAENRYGKWCASSHSVTGNVIRVWAYSACFHHPGAVAYSVLYGDFEALASGADTDEFDAWPEDGFSPVSSEPGGYWLLGADGGVFSFGSARFYGSTGDIRLNAPVVGMSAQPDGNGYRFVAADGGVFTYGKAGFFGSTGDMRLNKPVVGMATTKSGNGYWLVASDGGVFTFGDAKFFGSTGDLPLNKPVIGIVPTKSGDGYWLIASDGGVFTFGDAPFLGSLGDIALSKPITDLAATTSGEGYYLLGEDGGIFTFGDAPYLGNGLHRTASTLTGIAVDPLGYRLVDDLGAVIGNGANYNFGDLAWNDIVPNAPIIAIVTAPNGR